MKKVCILCSFLIAVKGNWRNSIFIECNNNCINKEITKCSGFLMSPDSEGCPILIPVNTIKEITGMAIDKTECLTTMNRKDFELLYSSWLDWQVDIPDECEVLQAYSHTRKQNSKNMF